jgi:hypothetical protein
VFENRMLRRITEPKKEDVVGGWTKMNTKELHNLYASPNIIRKIKSRSMRCVGHVTCMKDMRNALKILNGRPEGKRPLARPRYTMEDNIKMDL